MKLALAVVLVSGCAVDLGPCDRTEAHRVVWDSFGNPMFEGQAMMVSSCGYGSFCHSAEIDAEKRFGAPSGLEYDLRLAGYDGEVDLDEVGRLRRMVEHAGADRVLIWSTVSSGRMPVLGAVGTEVHQSAPVYYRAIPDEPMAALGSPQGREALRNWLACDLPIVERTALVASPPSGYVPVGVSMDPVQVEPLMPTWTSIYTRLIEARCNGAPCHGSSASGELDLRDSQMALAALVDQPAQGEECEETNAQLIVPGDPDHSLFYTKLAGRDVNGEPVCGRLMPQGSARLSAANLAAIREWIMAGAMP